MNKRASLCATSQREPSRHIHPGCIQSRTTACRVAPALARLPRRNPEGVEVAAFQVELGTDGPSFQGREVGVVFPRHQVLGAVRLLHQHAFLLGEAGDGLSRLVQQLDGQRGLLATDIGVDKEVCPVEGEGLGQQRASKMSIEDFMRLLDAFLERNIHFK